MLLKVTDLFGKIDLDRSCLIKCLLKLLNSIFLLKLDYQSFFRNIRSDLSSTSTLIMLSSLSDHDLSILKGWHDGLLVF